MPQGKVERARQGQKASSGNLLTRDNANTGLLLKITGIGSAADLRPEVNLTNAATDIVDGVYLEDHDTLGIQYGIQGRYWIQTTSTPASADIGTRILPVAAGTGNADVGKCAPGATDLSTGAVGTKIIGYQTINSISYYLVEINLP